MCAIVARIALFVYAFYYNSGNGIVGLALGPCSFQSGWCEFTNDDSNSLDWDRTAVNATSEYALTFTSVRPSSDKTGRITSPTVVLSNTYKCLEFSFNTKNTVDFPGSLKVFHKTTTEENRIWATNSTSGGYWKHVLVDLYNTTLDYKIIFEAKLNRNSNEWIAIDKVSVLDGGCFSNFLCDFEDSFCMTQDYQQDTFDWRRHRGSTASSWTGPTLDHTLGTNLGFYAYIETSYYSYSYYNSYYTGSARMKTPKQRSSSGISERCLEFWYHMYGSNIGRLDVYLAVGSNEVKIFNKTGNGGNVWKTAHVPITEQNNYKIIFEAFRGTGYRGDIAVDDIKISREKCLIGFQCDFDHGPCVNQDSTDNKDWTIGKFTHYDDYYVTVYDHTSSTWAGKYAYLDSEYFRENEIARISTPLLTSETNNKFCLMFWYNEMGEDSGQLFVFLSNSGSNSGNLIWKRHIKNQYNNVWRKGEVTFVPDDNYKIVFQANGGSGTDGYLAIDDIKINNEPCRNIEDFNCTFESETFCLERGASSDNYGWKRHSRFSNYGAGPFFDHTIGDDKGHYAFVDSHGWNNINDTALMITPVIHNAEVNGTKCLIFWYHMYGFHIESLEVFLLKMSDDLPGTPIWSRSGNRGNIWRPAEVELSEENSFQIVFRSIRGGGVDGDIGVDDIQIRNGSCFNTGKKMVTGVSCQFEETHLCGYTQSTDDDFDWTWTNSALGTKHEAPGIPTIDHTTSSGLGFYLIADFRSTIMIRQVFRLQSPVVDATSKQCLEFWHYIHGTDSQELRVLLNQTGSSIKTILSIKGTRGPYWQRAIVEISPTVKYQIVFEALSGVTPNGAITIDDVNVTSGNCKAIPTTVIPLKTVKEADCDFEKHDLCGYQQATDDDFDWSAQTAAEMANYFNRIWWYNWWGVGHEWYPSSDRTYPDSDEGTFMYNEITFWWRRWWKGLEKESRARLLSPLIEKTDTRTCLKFWVYKQSYSSDYLNVYMVPYSQVLNGDPLVHFFGSYGNRWTLRKIDLPPSPENFQIIFEVINGDRHHSSSFIDEVDFERSPCTNDDILCDFENGFVDCPVLKDRSKSDGFQWQLSRGRTATKMTGPSVDHTRGDETGIYIYIDASQPQRAGDTASVSTHQWYNNKENTCLTFWYYCNSSLSGTFFANKHEKTNKELIWEMPRIFESRWTEVRILIPPANDSYQIVFTGTIGNSILGDIALDDIKLSPSSCSVPSSELTPPIDAMSSPTSAALQSYDCKIVNGKSTCDIDQLSSDQFDWLYSESGNSYVCTSKSKYVGQKAQLTTPQFVKNKQQCLTIVYQTSGVLVPDLSVFKLVPTSNPALLWNTNATVDNWTTKMITIQSSPSSYNIMFEATIRNIGNGTVSIQSINISPGKCRNSSVNQVVAIIVSLIVLVILVTIALAVYRWRHTLTFHLNVRHKTLTEDVSIGKAHSDKSPIVDA